MEQVEKIGKYEIIDKIGEGGFGVVYKGRDPFIKRLVAVKTCSSENDQIQQRFFREAEIAGNLHHANVVTIHDFGVENDTPYLVQEFLTGEDLDVLIKGSFDSLDLPRKVRYLRGVAEGLRYAHTKGVIHRDIKPGNIRILENDRVKVMDFGIAKLKGQESQLTQTGMALGTVAYMSPEQLKGEQVDHRADIFSYGVLAFELLTGGRPFRAETVSTLFYQLLHEPAPPIEVEGMPSGLEQIVDRCLEKNAADRFQDFGEVIAELAKVQATLGGEEESSGDLFTPDAESESQRSAERLAAKAQRSIDAGDLTAAAMTIDMARRRVESAAFQRIFADVLPAYDQLKQLQEEGAAAQPELSDEISRVAADVELKLVAEDFTGARRLIGKLERRYPGEPRVQTLRQRLSAMMAAQPTLDEATGSQPAPIVPPPAPTPASPTPPPIAPAVPAEPEPVLEGPRTPASPVTGRKAPWLALAAAAVGVVVIVLILRAVLGGGAESQRLADTEQPPERQQAGDASQTTASSPATPSADDSTTRAEHDLDSAADAPIGGTKQPAAEGEEPTPPPEQLAQDRDVKSSTQPAARDEPPATRSAETPTRQADRVEPPPSREATKTAQRSTPQQSRPDRSTTRQPTSPQRQRSKPAETKPEAAAESTPTAPPVTPTVDLTNLREQESIRRSLQAFQAAWASLDHEAINNIHPSANVQRRDLRPYRTATVSFRDCVFEIDGERAIARCSVTRTLNPKQGSAQTERFSGFRLSKQGARWVVESLIPGG